MIKIILRPAWNFLNHRIIIINNEYLNGISYYRRKTWYGKILWYTADIYRISENSSRYRELETCYRGVSSINENGIFYTHSDINYLSQINKEAHWFKDAFTTCYSDDDKYKIQ